MPKHRKVHIPLITLNEYIKQDKVNSDSHTYIFINGRWVQSQAKKDGAEEHLAKYDGECKKFTKIGNT